MEAAMHNIFGKGKRSEILKLDFFYEKPCAQVCRSEPQQQCSTEHVEECWVEQQEQCQVTQETR